MLYAGVMRQLFMTRPTWHQSVLIHFDLPSTQLCMHDNGPGGWGFDEILPGSAISLYISLTPPLLPYPDDFLGGSRTLEKHVIY